MLSPFLCQRWGSSGDRGNFEGSGSADVRAASNLGLRSLGPDVSGGSVSEPSGAPSAAREEVLLQLRPRRRKAG